MSKRPRDSQRQRVYDAEGVAFTAEHYKPKMSIDDCQALVDDICASPAVQTRYPLANDPPLVKASRSDARRGRCFYDEHEIRLPLFSRMPYYVIHELVHHLTGGSGQWMFIAGHGWEFCECYLYLLGKFNSPFTKAALQNQFDLKRIKYQSPDHRLQAVAAGSRERRD